MKIERIGINKITMIIIYFIDEGFGSWLTQALKPGNFFDSRMGKAAEVLNVCRGLKFKSEKGLCFVKISA